jgi:hypothetical protein
MHLIQLLLPLADDQKRAFPRAEYDRVRTELAQRFGGVTFYLRAPAEGVWTDPGGEVEHDQVVVAEVMAAHLEREWWKLYRTELERRFRQDRVLVRVMPCELL